MTLSATTSISQPVPRMGTPQELVGKSWEMPVNHPISPLIEQIRTELEVLATEGLWDADASKIEGLRRLLAFGGSHDEPALLTVFRGAFRELLKTNEELAGAPSEMAVRLFGVEAPYRGLTPGGRIGAIGQVEWRGRTVLYDAARRRGGRRDEVLDRVAAAITLVETALSATASELAKPATVAAVEVEGLAPVSEMRQKRLRKISWSIAALGAAIVAFLILGVLTLGNDPAGNAAAIPPPGSIVDATNGKVYPPQAASRFTAASPGSLDTLVLQSCDPEITKPCVFSGEPNEHLPVARRGDKINFRLYLHNPFDGPISLLKIRVYWEGERHAIFVELQWLGIAGKRRHSFEPERAGQPEPYSDRGGFGVTFINQRGGSLAYIPGSAAIYTSPQEGTGNRVAHLPDGIMDTGIAITDVAAPRYITFSTQAL
jgi:hypothetical protein